MTRRSGPEVKPEIGMVVEMARVPSGDALCDGPGGRRTIRSTGFGPGNAADGTVDREFWNFGCYDILSDAPEAKPTPAEPSAHDVHFQAVMRLFREYLLDLDSDIEGCSADELTEVEHENTATLELRKRYIAAARAIDPMLVERVDDGLAKYAYRET